MLGLCADIWQWVVINNLSISPAVPDFAKHSGVVDLNQKERQHGRKKSDKVPIP